MRKIQSRLRLIKGHTLEAHGATASQGLVCSNPTAWPEEPAPAPARIETKASERDTYKNIRERMVNFLHQQAREVETISTSIQQIRSKAQTMLDERRSQKSTLTGLVESAQHALQDIHSITQAFAEIRSIKASIDELLAIEESVRQSLTEIDSVVLNSKILAFNASLEASRAGAGGKGFLVVSEKMREFSHEIAAIAKSIRVNTEKSKTTLGRVTQALDDGFQKMENASLKGAQLVQVVQRGIHQIEGQFGASLEDFDGHTGNLKELQESVAATVENSSSASAEMVSFLQDSQIDQLEPKEAFARLTRFHRIIDVRRADEFNAELGHIEGAELITIDESFAKKIASFPRDLNYIFICRSGGRSARAARIAIDMGFLHVTNMVGGMLKWKDEGLPVS